MDDRQKRQLKHRKRSARFRVFTGFLVSAVCIWWVLRSVELERVFAEISNARFGYLFLAFLTTCFSYVLRAYRWPFFFGEIRLTFLSSFRCLIIGFFMNNVLPVRMGELVRAHVGGRASGQSRSTVLATIAGERLADGLAISFLFAVLFTMGASNVEIARGKEIYFVACLFLAAALFTSIVLVKREKIFNCLEALGQIMPGHLSTYTLTRLRKFIEGLEPLLVPIKVAQLSLLSLLVWLVELLVYHQVTQAFGYSEQMTIGTLSLFLAAVNFSSLIPAAPGAIGVIEAFATYALVRVGVPHETAFAMVASQHVVQLLVVGVPGAFFFFYNLGGKLPEVEDEEEDEDWEWDVSHGESLSSFVETPVLDEAWVPDLVDFSVVIPAYNEEQRLPKTLLSVLNYIRTRKETFEVIVVDDGSSDGTAAVIRQFERLSPVVRLLSYGHNRGKGYAVRFGVLNSNGRLVLFSDADGATPIEELERLKSAINLGADLVIASRALYSKDTYVETSVHRKFIGRVFNGIVNLLILPGVADTQCGFKLFRREAAKYLFSRQRADGFSFDVELLFLARKFGFRMIEVPVNWINIPGSKVNLFKDSWRMFVDILRFRFRYVCGKYEELYKT